MDRTFGVSSERAEFQGWVTVTTSFDVDPDLRRSAGMRPRCSTDGCAHLGSGRYGSAR